MGQGERGFRRGRGTNRQRAGGSPRSRTGSSSAALLGAWSSFPRCDSWRGQKKMPKQGKEGGGGRRPLGFRATEPRLVGLVSRAARSGRQASRHQSMPQWCRGCKKKKWGGKKNGVDAGGAREKPGRRRGTVRVWNPAIQYEKKRMNRILSEKLKTT